MDPKDLNENIKRERYQIPKREEITSEMVGARYFSKLDASQGFGNLDWMKAAPNTALLMHLLADTAFRDYPLELYQLQRYSIEQWNT